MSQGSMGIDYPDRRFYLPEDLVAKAIRGCVPEWVAVSCELSEVTPVPCVLVHTAAGAPDFEGQEQWHVQVVDCDIWVFVEGTNSKLEGNYIIETIRVGLVQAAKRGALVAPGVALTSVSVLQAGHRETDWAPAVGPVQYADLPQGMDRFATAYRFAFHYLAGMNVDIEQELRR